MNPDTLEQQARERLALDDLACWSGHPADLRTLRITAAVARLLAADGYGADELAALGMADAVLRQRRANSPGITGVSRADLASLRWLLAYADAQRAAVTGANTTVRCIACARRDLVLPRRVKAGDRHQHDKERRQPPAPDRAGAGLPTACSTPRRPKAGDRRQHHDLDVAAPTDQHHRRPGCSARPVTSATISTLPCRRASTTAVWAAASGR